MDTRRKGKPVKARLKSRSAGPRARDVDSYLRGIDGPRQLVMQVLRKMILGIHPRITEEIKWNAPSFARGEHFATFNAWAKDDVQLILHHGPKRSSDKKTLIGDPEGLLEWLAADRARICFRDLKDVQTKKAALQSILKQWIKKSSGAA